MTTKSEANRLICFTCGKTFGLMRLVSAPVGEDVCPTYLPCETCEAAYFQKGIGFFEASDAPLVDDQLPAVMNDPGGDEHEVYMTGRWFVLRPFDVEAVLDGDGDVPEVARVALEEQLQRGARIVVPRDVFAHMRVVIATARAMDINLTVAERFSQNAARSAIKPRACHRRGGKEALK